MPLLPPSKTRTNQTPRPKPSIGKVPKQTAGLVARYSEQRRQAGSLK